MEKAIQVNDLKKEKDPNASFAALSASMSQTSSNPKKKTSRAITLDRLEQVLACPNLTKDLNEQEKEKFRRAFATVYIFNAGSS